MTPFGWFVLVALLAVLAWLGFALVGVVRELAALRERLESLEGAANPVRLDGGLPVGAAAPAWSITTPDGATATSSAFAGRRHLLVFADADCRACDELLPAVVGAAAAGAVPPVAVIGRGRPDQTPSAWVGDDRATVTTGAEVGREVSDAFGVQVSPHAFVIDEGGAVVAQGAASSLADVVALVRDAHGIRIVSETVDG
jgi:hypothetical protein